jgi:hypothetical protein
MAGKRKATLGRASRSVNAAIGFCDWLASDRARHLLWPQRSAAGRMSTSAGASSIIEPQSVREAKIASARIKKMQLGPSFLWPMWIISGNMARHSSATLSADNASL